MSTQPTKIDQKIVGYAVVSGNEKTSDKTKQAPDNTTIGAGTDAQAGQDAYKPTIMNEHVARPSVLTGTTYKIEKSPASEHAMYVTINDIVLDQGTIHEERLPFEIFINSKNMEQFQWVVAMTRILSAVFRKGGDVSFLAEEMKAVFEPKGGYFKAGGYVPSLVAEIGQIIEKHLQSLGLIEMPGMDPMAAALIAEKRQALSSQVHGNKKQAPGTAEKREGQANAGQDSGSEEADLQFPANATMCSKCSQKAVVVLDGCATCLNCGNSKCG